MADDGLNMSDPKAVVELLAKDLQGPGVAFCPNPKMGLWNQHPRVYIDVASTAGLGSVFSVRLPLQGPVLPLSHEELQGDPPHSST